MYLTISTHWVCDSVCVRACARLFIFALRLTPQVTAHTANAHQTLRVRPIFHPFDFVESFVRCHHGDLNRLCRLLNWQRYSSSSCHYFPPLPLCQYIFLFSPFVCANLPFCHPYCGHCSITPCNPFCLLSFFLIPDVFKFHQSQQRSNMFIVAASSTRCSVMLL